MNSTATPNSVATRLSALCTGLRNSTTPSAPPRQMAPASRKVEHLDAASVPAPVAVVVVGRRPLGLGRGAPRGWPPSGARTP